MRTHWPSTSLLLFCAVGAAGCANILGIDGDYHEVAEQPLDAGGADGVDGGSRGDSGGNSFCTAHDGVVWEGHCYFQLSASAAQTWTNAKSACAAFPSTHLVTITSAPEQAFVEAHFASATQDQWIGLALANTSQAPASTCSTTANSCPFSWVTREPLGYTHWTQRPSGTNEPDYTGSCVRLLSAEKTWADTDCTTHLPALCEAD